MSVENLTITFRVSLSDSGAHVTMSEERAHDTESRDCWCRPTFSRVCDECTGGVGCWKCERGLIRITREEAEHVGEPLVIVHR